MERTSFEKLIASVILTLISARLASGTIQTQTTTSEPAEYSTFAEISNTTELIIDNGMVIRDIREETTTDRGEIFDLQRENAEELNTEASGVRKVPENHKNYTPNQYFGDTEYPSVYKQLNKYHQQYQTYYDQMKLNNRKPIKFEENSSQNYYIPQKGKGDTKSEQTEYILKPFPYAFEGHNSLQDNWYKPAHGPGHVVFPHKGSHEYHYDHRGNQDLANDSGSKSPWQKVAQLLTTLLPLGLLLATLTPTVFTVDSPSNIKTSRQRSEESIESKFNEEDILKVMKKYGIKSFSLSRCEDRVLCEVARMGKDGSENSIEKGFWHLANKTPSHIAEQAGMGDLFQAIKNGTCESYRCEITSKDKTKKKVVRRRSDVK